MSGIRGWFGCHGIEQIGRTTLDLSGRPAVLALGGFLGWAPCGRAGPSVAIVGEDQGVSRAAKITSMLLPARSDRERT